MKLNDEQKDTLALVLGVVVGSLGSTTFEVARQAFSVSLILWAVAVGEYAVFFILGIYIARKPIKRMYAKQREADKRGKYDKIENLRLHLAELELSLKSSKLQKSEGELLENYNNIFSKIDDATKKIEEEMKNTETL